MLMGARLGLWGGKKLPYDAEVEYLESTGTQYIDTPVVWNPFTTKVTATFSTTVTDTQYIFGSYGSAHNFIGTRRASGSTMQILPSAGLSSTFGDIHTVTAYNVSRTYYEILDGTGVTISNANSNTTNTLSIFCINGFTSNIFNGRIYRLYLTDIATGQIIADLIPVHVGSVGYLYDRVSGQLFGNAGTGEFGYGPDVVPVEYLGFGGAQYFSTGVYAIEDTRIEARLKTISTGNRNWFGGSLTGVGGSASGFVFNSFNSNTIEYLFGNGGWKTPYSAGVVGKVFDLDFGKDAVKVDGTTISTPSYTAFDTQTAAILLGVRYAGSAYITGQAYSFDIYEGQTVVRKFRPVRVGTEGAMLDTLTRRIYRNAGTGAFTYGADLPYPIGGN